MKRPKKFYIKERALRNAGPSYFVALGQLSPMEALKARRAVVTGKNIMHPFDTEEAYASRLAELRAAGENIIE